MSEHLQPDPRVIDAEARENAMAEQEAFLDAVGERIEEEEKRAIVLAMTSGNRSVLVSNERYIACGKQDAGAALADMLSENCELHFEVAAALFVLLSSAAASSDQRVLASYRAFEFMATNAHLGMHLGDMIEREMKRAMQAGAAPCGGV